MNTDETTYEAAYNDALEAVGTGATVAETRAWIARHYPALTADDTTTILTDALDDARSCGIEREDIDPSWF